MNDMRRTMLWVVFSMSLFLLYDGWNKANGKPSLFSPVAVTKPAAAPAAGSAAVPAVGVSLGASAVLPSSTLPTSTAGATPASVPAALPTAAPAATLSEKVTITTDVVKATLDTQGGDVVRLELLQQLDHTDRTKNTLVFDQSVDRLYKAQTGLIPAPGGAALPNHLTRMTLVQGDVPGDRELKAGANELQVKFESPDVGGAKLVKTFTFKRADYVVAVKHEVVNTGTATINPQLYLQLLRDGNAPAGESSFYFTFTGPAVYTDASKFTKIDFKTIEKHKAGEKLEHDTAADNGWVAMVQHYFASAWMLGATADEKRPREFFTKKVATNEYSVGMLVPLGSLEPGATKTLESRLFAGPQEENKLSAMAPGLELVKDYGWFTILAKPLFWLLTQLHSFIGNWGWSIVALVVCLKVAFYWLNATAYRSMAKMKSIGPKITEMRERLKDKPQQMQQEMMRIYKEEKVNPLGGCLPIFVQMPFFIALYWVLLSTVEMRNAPWLGWITDLSAKDPYFILPILMTLTSLMQTWLNPTPPDPMQAKMMWIMPLIFSVMFFVFPAGLVLYWLTNNILSIAQQYLINKQLGVLGK